MIVKYSDSYQCGCYDSNIDSNDAYRKEHELKFMPPDIASRFGLWRSKYPDLKILYYL